MMCSIAIAQSKPFTIKGKISGSPTNYIYLYYTDGESGKPRMDSALIKKGRFTFKGQLNGPAQAGITVDRPGQRMNKYAQLYLVPGNMELKMDYNNFNDGLALKGSYVQDEADALTKTKALIFQNMKPLSDAYNKANNAYGEARKANKDEATLEALKEAANKAKDAMDPYYDQMRKAEKEFMDKNPSSYVTASMLRYSISNMKLAEGEERYNKLTEEIKNSSLGKELKKELDGIRMGSPGAKAYVFASKVLRGENLSLSDYKGKYVLLDFWASWCVPCRKGNPHLLSLYSKYKDRGFEIIGISDDDSNLEAWKKAVEKDKIGVWKHVLRGLDMKKRMAGEENPSDISEYYGIHSLPTKILIDHNGVIIGRYGGGGGTDEDLDAKLAEVMPTATVLNLNGYIKGLKDSSLNIGWYDETGYQKENILVQNERFTWTKKLVEPQKVFISNSRGYMEFYAENGNINIDGSMDNFYESKVTGSAIQDEYAKHKAKVEPFLQEFYKIAQELHGTKVEKEKLILETKMDSIRILMDAEDKKYVSQHPGSIVSLSLVENEALMGEYADVNSLYAVLSPEMKATIAGKRLSERLEVLKRSDIGTPLKDFSMRALDGKMVKLADFKGKYVFVDFWASWCGPCRAENPNVLKAYNTYKKKNFTVLGVSLDDNRDKWKAAVEKDKMPWTQISDLKGFENELSSYYGIRAIPTTYLIDPQGKIIAKGLRGAKLHTRLAEILN